MMQNLTINVKVCINLLENLIDYFKKYRSDENFNNIMDEANEIADDLNVEPSFPPMQAIRPRRKRKLFDYEQGDEIVVDPKSNFKTNFFNKILDQTLSSLTNRFEELKTFDDIFGFFSNLSSISEEELLKHCKDLHLKLKDDSRGEADIDGIDLFNELKVLKLHFL